MGRFARLLALFLSLVPAGAMADELRFITIDAAPWAWVDGQGRAQGAFPAIVAELERRTGHRIAVAIQSFPRIERALETGEQDCTIILWNEARARIVERGEPVYPMPFGVIARKGVALAGYDDLRNLRISVVRGLAIDPRFDADETLRKDFDRDYTMGLQKIAHGRLDAIAGALPTILYQAEIGGTAGSLGDSLAFTTIPLTLQCSKRSPKLGLLAGLNDAVAALRGDGTLARLLAQHHYR